MNELGVLRNRKKAHGARRVCIWPGTVIVCPPYYSLTLTLSRERGQGHTLLGFVAERKNFGLYSMYDAGRKQK